MNPAYVTTKSLNAFISAALKEDVGDGDHSSLASIPENATSSARLLIKAEGMLAGVDLAKHIFHFIDKTIQFSPIKGDGNEVREGEIGFTIEGNVRSILKSERLVLNCMQRMSGIATKTSEFTKLIRHTKATILDTRKTTPGFRMAEKWAVNIGGAQNHRFGLFDLIMLKDNHIDFAGGIEKAIKSTQSYLKKSGKTLRVEIETRGLKEVEQVLNAGGVDIIMLDNMLPSEMKQAVAMIDGRFETEASGGITEQNIREVAETGVNYISVGALTHSYNSLDLSLKAIN